MRPRKATAEKMRRERWTKEQTKKIQEATIRGCAAHARYPVPPAA